MGAFKEMSDTAAVAGLVAEFAEMDRTGEQWADGLCDLLFEEVGGDRGTCLWEAAYSAYTEAKAAARSLATAPVGTVVRLESGLRYVRVLESDDEEADTWASADAKSSTPTCTAFLAELGAVVTFLPQAVTR